MPVPARLDIGGSETADSGSSGSPAIPGSSVAAPLAASEGSGGGCRRSLLSPPGAFSFAAEAASVSVPFRETAFPAPSSKVSLSGIPDRLCLAQSGVSSRADASGRGRGSSLGKPSGWLRASIRASSFSCRMRCLSDISACAVTSAPLGSPFAWGCFPSTASSSTRAPLPTWAPTCEMACCMEYMASAAFFCALLTCSSRCSLVLGFTRRPAAAAAAAPHSAASSSREADLAAALRAAISSTWSSALFTCRDRSEAHSQSSVLHAELLTSGPGSIGEGTLRHAPSSSPPELAGWALRSLSKAVTSALASPSSDGYRCRCCCCCSSGAAAHAALTASSSPGNSMLDTCGLGCGNSSSLLPEGSRIAAASFDRLRWLTASLRAIRRSSSGGSPAFSPSCSGETVSWRVTSAPATAGASPSSRFPPSGKLGGCSGMPASSPDASPPPDPSFGSSGSC
mmetsp:Transcript_28042/g.66598  ORF Transcript_28042/g.66598 Transcript_28042/m.66598 type:complete len:454 (-) Transcript_28042:1876-3237(-)